MRSTARRGRGRPLAGLALLAILPLTPAPASAQRRPAPGDTARRDSAAVRALPPIQVVGSILSVAGPAVASGVPARTSVVAREALARWRPRLLAGALAAQPGVSLYDDLGSPFKPTLVTRGFTASPVVGLPQGVSVFVDGVPVNEADAGQVNFDLLPLGHVERIEVLGGTASLLGPNSFGGAVNLVTRRGDGPATGEIEVGGGSFGRYTVEGSAGGGANGWSWYAGGGWEREGGWRQLTRARAGQGFVNVGREWARGDEANETEPLEGYWIADAHAGWAVGAWEARAVVRNVLDAGYVAFGTFNLNQAAGNALERFLTPGEPRRLELSLRRAFGVAR